MITLIAENKPKLVCIPYVSEMSKNSLAVRKPVAELAEIAKLEPSAFTLWGNSSPRMAVDKGYIVMANTQEYAVIVANTIHTKWGIWWTLFWT